MKRRSFLTKTFGIGAALAAVPAAAPLLRAEEAKTNNAKGLVIQSSKLTPPPKGKIPVAVVISDSATLIDFAGPWEVFQSVMIPERGTEMSEHMPYEVFTVSDKVNPITVEGGMKVVPNYTFANVPECKVAVVGAQRGSEEMQDWLRKTAPIADVTMSVCTGVIHLAKAGLLAGKSATTHHNYSDQFAKDHPDIDVKRGVRFVENEKISTSGGEICGIDLALRIVERYFGRAVAKQAAFYMEYQGEGWIVG